VDEETGKFVTYFQNIHAVCYQCQKCKCIIHQVDYDRLSKIIFLKNNPEMEFYGDMSPDIVNAVPPVDGEYKVNEEDYYPNKKK
jgi:hypothetical protein